MLKLIKKVFFFYKKIDFLYSLYINIFEKKYLIEEKRVLEQLKELEKLSDIELVQLQQKKLLDILQYAYANCPYYTKLFKEHNINLNEKSFLEEIPFLTKEIIKKNKTDIQSNQFSVSSLVPRNTGGSTGTPLEFYSDKMAAHIDNAHHSYLFSLMGYNKNEDVILDSGGIYITRRLRNKNIYWIPCGRQNTCGDYVFSVLYITDQNIKYYIDKILLIKPAIMRGYPSFFDKLATYIINMKITLPFKVKGINLTAEMCSGAQRKNIEKAFSTTVYFEYGHSEVSVFCYTQDTNYLYKSSPIYGYIEVINDDGNPAMPGETGNVIATSFCNYGMPFIRYKTGDQVELISRNGGIISFKNIHGRTQDYILSKDNQKVFLTALVFGQHLKAFKNIIQWQLKQDIPGVITVKIVKSNDYSIADEKEITEKFQSVTNIDLKFIYVDKIPLTNRGKHLFLINNLKVLSNED